MSSQGRSWDTWRRWDIASIDTLMALACGRPRRKLSTIVAASAAAIATHANRRRLQGPHHCGRHPPLQCLSRHLLQARHRRHRVALHPSLSPQFGADAIGGIAIETLPSGAAHSRTGAIQHFGRVTAVVATSVLP